MPHGGTTNHVNGGPRGGNLQGSLRRASGVEGLTRNQNLAEKSRWTRRRKTGEGHTRCEYGLPQRVISGSVINTMRVTPREDAGWRLCPRKLDRQPSLFCLCSSGSTRGLCRSSRKRQQKKRSLTHADRAWSDRAFRRQLSRSFTGPSKRYSLLYEPDHYIWFISVYFPTGFVKTFFNILFETSSPLWTSPLCFDF